jgi:hypothetical protein
MRRSLKNNGTQARIPRAVTIRRFCLASFLALQPVALLALAPAASGDGRIPPSGQFYETRTVAVSAKENNDIFAIHNSQAQLVEQLDPGGNRVMGFGWGVVPGAAAGTGNLTAGSTVVSHATTTSGRFLHGQIVSGPGIPPDTTIREITSTEMELSNAPSISTAGATLTSTAAPGNVPTNDRQKLTVAATGGEFSLTFVSPEPGRITDTTKALHFNATAAEVEASLAELENIGSGNVSVSGGPGDSAGTSPYLIEFTGRYADVNVLQLSPSHVTLSGGSPTSFASIITLAQGASALETCTSVCVEASTANYLNGPESEITGSEPGQFVWPDAMAVDNSPTSSSYGAIYIIDQSHYRVEKYALNPTSHEYEFLLMFGGGVNHTTGANVCSAANVAEGDVCGEGEPGTGPSHFYRAGGAFNELQWNASGHNSIAVGPDGTVYVGDFERVQEFKPDGTYLGELSVPYGEFVDSLAVNSANDVYANVARHDEVQRFVPPTSGKFTLTFKGQTTEPLPHNISYYYLGPKIRELSTVGGGNFADEGINLDISEYEGAFYFTFENKLGGQEVPLLEAELVEPSPPAPESLPVTRVRVGNPGTLLKLGPSGELLEILDAGGKPNHIGLDSAGNLFVEDSSAEIRNACRTTNEERLPENCPYDTYLAYHPSGELYAIFASDQAHIWGWSASGIAVGDASQSIYAAVGTYIDVIPIPQPGPPGVKQEEVRSVEPTTATLRAVVNPRGYDTKYYFEFGETAAFGHKTSVKDLGPIIRDYPVQAAISGLQPKTTYHYRVVAESMRNGGETVYGPDQTFETLPAVSYRNLTTQTVGPELVTLKAELNPNGSESTFSIRYGSDEAYSGGTSHGTLLLGNEFEGVSATFSGLTPNTTYHYQLVAENEYGEVTSPDQVFTTEQSVAESSAGCINNPIREEINALSLSDCRAWEQVTPSFKAGSGTDQSIGGVPWLSPSGERVAFSSKGVFAGAVNVIFNSYLAHRTGGGWETQAVSLRPGDTSFQPGFTASMAPELNLWLNHAKEGLTKEEAEEDPRGSAYYRGDMGGSFVKATPTLKIVDNEHGFFDSLFGSAADFSRIFIVTPRRLLESDPRPGHERGVTVPGDRIYEVTGGGGPDPTLKLLVELPSGVPDNDGCGIDAWTQNAANQVSSDGSTLFYDASLELIPGAECETGSTFHGPNKSALFAQIDEEPPIQLSAPPSSQCSYPSPCSTSPFRTAEFWGASPDGSRAWFTTAEPLINSDKDLAGDLYLAKLQGGQLNELVDATEGDATDPHRGENAGLKGVTAVSPDATSAAFVASGVLTTNENGLHQSAAQGAYNLYTFDATSDETRFVAELCTGPGKSGSLADPACPTTVDNGENNDSALWNGQRESRASARFTPDGHYMVFAAWGRLAPGDTDGVRDVYRYDLQTGHLIRVSFARNGNDANGDDDRFEALLTRKPTGAESSAMTTEDASRVISADGSLVIFETSAPLVSHDTNEANDVYEWEEDGSGTCHEATGCVSLVSDGLDRHGVVESSGRISSSGRDIVFVTARSLVPTDADGLPDVYDARLNGGFPVSRPEPACEGADTCREGVSPSPPGPVIGTSQFVGPGNSAEHLECAKGKVRVEKHGQVRCVARHHRRGRHRKRHRQGGMSQGRVRR